MEFQGGADFVGEEETIEMLRTFLSNQGISEQDIEWQVRRISCADFALPADPVMTLSADGVLRSLIEPAQSSASSEAISPPLAVMDEPAIVEAIAAED